MKINKLFFVLLVLLTFAACKKEEPEPEPEPEKDLYLTEISYITFLSQAKLKTNGATYKYWDEDDNSGADITISIYEQSTNKTIYSHDFEDNASSPLHLLNTLELKLIKDDRYTISFVDRNDNTSNTGMGQYSFKVTEATDGLKTGKAESPAFVDDVGFNYIIEAK